jgi:hypothetical protein
MGTNKDTNKTQGRTLVQAYVRRLFGSNRQASGWAGMYSTKLSLPKWSNSGVVGTAPHLLPRQLQATAYTAPSRRSQTSGSGVGNVWFVSPIASTVKSILSFFVGDSSTAQSTRYRSSGRKTFAMVESISPEQGSGPRPLNETAAGLTGVVAGSWSGGDAPQNSPNVTGATATVPMSGAMTQFEDRQAMLTALRRGMSESRGIADVLSEFQDGL